MFSIPTNHPEHRAHLKIALRPPTASMITTTDCVQHSKRGNVGNYTRKNGCTTMLHGSRVISLQGVPGTAVNPKVQFDPMKIPALTAL